MTLAQFVNQNSYTIAAAVVLAISQLFILWRVRRKKIALAFFFAACLTLVLVNLTLRVGTSEIGSTQQFDEILAARQPLVLEIYSNY